MYSSVEFKFECMGGGTYLSSGPSHETRLGSESSGGVEDWTGPDSISRSAGDEVIVSSPSPSSSSLFSRSGSVAEDIRGDMWDCWAEGWTAWGWLVEVRVGPELSGVGPGVDFDSSSKGSFISSRGSAIPPSATILASTMDELMDEEDEEPLWVGAG